MNGESRAFADRWLSNRAELRFKLKMSRYDLTDFKWRVIKPLLPNKPRGVPRVDGRRVPNWLPAPKSSVFGITMRLSAPRPEVADGFSEPVPSRTQVEFSRFNFRLTRVG